MALVKVTYYSTWEAENADAPSFEVEVRARGYNEAGKKSELLYLEKFGTRDWYCRKYNPLEPFNPRGPGRRGRLVPHR